MVSAVVEKHIKANAERAYEANHGVHSNPYAKLEGKSELAELWTKFYREYFDADRTCIYDDRVVEPSQKVLDIIEANNQSTLRDMMIYRYAKFIYDQNASGWEDDVPDFSSMSDEELLDEYGKKLMVVFAPRG